MILLVSWHCLISVVLDMTSVIYGTHTMYLCTIKTWSCMQSYETNQDLVSYRYHLYHIDSIVFSHDPPSAISDNNITLPSAQFVLFDIKDIDVVLYNVISMVYQLNHYQEWAALWEIPKFLFQNAYF